jgi:hypothetical protein
MRKIVILLLLMTGLGAEAQDSVRHRVILIGDAGEINHEQTKVIPDAAKQIISGKTSVFFLGDNVYPRGMGLPGGKEEENTKRILRSQFEPLRAGGAPVYFIPGNHDWDRMRKKGLAKVRAQSDFLASYRDSLLQMVPSNGCPDPTEINVSDSLTVIAYDSEWWLFPYDKTNPDCDCRSEKEVVDKMDSILYKNRFKVVLLASHHPFQSYGTHGGKYSLRDHVFPFTRLNKKLWIPMPVVGSLYPLLRSSIFNSPEDQNHPLYKRMIKKINHVLEGFPNLVNVAGHEHGLQLIKSEQLQVVSGAGSKNSYARKGKNALFADATQGFVTMDLLEGNSLIINFYSYKNGSLTEAYTYTQPYTRIDPPVNAPYEPATQPDSVTIKANARYDYRGRFHRKVFGENYRKEWAADTRVPVIRISKFAGGLTPLQRGGGMQSTSLRLADPTGKEWVIRSVNKNPDPLLPEDLRETFARDWLDDGMSGQHPYSTLIVPPIAEAVRVPHANPIIGIIAADSSLGIHNRTFANTLCLLEEREPLGSSDNTPKMLRNLNKDNDNEFQAKAFFRARMLDLLIGDWDRHEDQWRWKNTADGKDKSYRAVPRDRDQVLHLTEGVIPTIASQSYVYPMLQGFGGKIKSIKYSLFKTKFLNARPESQFSHKEWDKMVKEFVEAVTDDVLEDALNRLPASSQFRYEELLRQLKERRANIPAAMEAYYNFSNRIVDIQTSNKNEFVKVTDADNGKLNVTIRKISKGGEIKGKLMDKNYDPNITREIRIYVNSGDDSVFINSKKSTIRLKIIGGKGKKTYSVIDTQKPVNVYDLPNQSTFYGTGKLRKHLFSDSSNTAFVPVNLYNSTMPLLVPGYNLDDGITLGVGFLHKQQEGFRKIPYSQLHRLTVAGALATGAFKINYKSEWIQAMGTGDLLLDAKLLAPDNTQNFFGVGNATAYDKIGSYRRYYRVRFDIYEVDPAIRWRSKKSSFLSIGPSLQYYRFDRGKNEGRFITNSHLIHSYDSSTVDKSKLFGGMVFNYRKDSRNSTILPTSGGFFTVKIMGYSGLNSFSKSFVQLLSEAAFFISLDRQSNIVLANRIGGGFTAGKTAFYQSLFLGGHENLLGYRQYRFAGHEMLYNNLEMRFKLAQVGSYILPGQLGMLAFYDAGKVWAKGYNSKKIHQGTGGGLYFAPASRAVFQLVAGYSQEGWYPYFTMGFRF